MSTTLDKSVAYKHFKLGLAPLFVLGLAASSALAQLPAEFLVEQASANSKTVKSLEELAEFARSAKLYRESVRTYDQILKFAPEHAKARQFLRFTRQKDGTWRQSPEFKEPKNASEDKFAEFSGKRAQILGHHTDRVLESYRRHHAAMTPNQRVEVLAQLMAGHPEHPGLRQAYGEARRDGGTPALTAADAPMLQATQKDLELASLAMVEAVPAPKPAVMTTAESGLEIPFPGATATEHCRAFASAAADEASEAVVRMQAGAPLFHRVFGVKARHRTGFTVYLLSSPSERSRFLERFPGIESDARALAERTDGVWAGPSHFADWSTNRARRIDGAVRQVFATMMMDEFGITVRHGFAEEGFGVFLTYHLTGTRLTWLVKRSPYANTEQTLKDRLILPGANWFDEARRVLDGPAKGSLPKLMTKDVNQMTDEDLLISYAMAGYLINVHQPKLASFLKSIGKGTRPEDAVREAFSCDLATLESQLLQWLQTITK